MEIDILATLEEYFEKCPPPPLDQFLDTRLRQPPANPDFTMINILQIKLFDALVRKNE